MQVSRRSHHVGKHAVTTRDVLDDVVSDEHDREPDDAADRRVFLMMLFQMSTIVNPMMPLIGAISSTIFFYSCYVIVRVACKPPSNRWKYSRTSTFYMTLTAMTLAVLTVFVSLMITRSVTPWSRVSLQKRCLCCVFAEAMT